MFFFNLKNSKIRRDIAVCDPSFNLGCLFVPFSFKAFVNKNLGVEFIHSALKENLQ